MRGHFDGAIMDIQLKFSTCLFVSMDSHGMDFLSSQWEFQDPKMEVLYHIRPYFVGIFPYKALYT